VLFWGWYVRAVSTVACVRGFLIVASRMGDVQVLDEGGDLGAVVSPVRGSCVR
jgi:hypothetical protein